METYVKLLYDRLDQDKQLQLFVIMQEAINEMHNTGAISQAYVKGYTKLHDPDPEVRVTEKVSLAKSIGKSFILSALPAGAKEENNRPVLLYETRVKYDPKFEKSIALCIQGGIEGLWQSGIMQKIKVKYRVTVISDHTDLSGFAQVISQLNSFYDMIDIEMCESSMSVQSQNASVPTASSSPLNAHAEDDHKQSNAVNKASKKTSLWQKLFGRK